MNEARRCVRNGPRVQQFRILMFSYGTARELSSLAIPIAVRTHRSHARASRAALRSTPIDDPHATLERRITSLSKYRGSARISCESTSWTSSCSQSPSPIQTIFVTLVTLSSRQPLAGFWQIECIDFKPKAVHVCSHTGISTTRAALHNQQQRQQFRSMSYLRDAL